MAQGALIVIDMLNPYDHEDAEPLMESVRQMLEQLSALLAAAQENGLQIVYVNDHHDDWSAGPKEIAERALNGVAPELVKPVLPPAEVPFIIKARHSIFYETLLEYLLRRENITRLVFTGQVTEQCILYSALDGYVRHFEVIVATDAIAHIQPDLADAAIKMMERNMQGKLVTGADAVLDACRA
jgi:nicotinamidase-related amidase